MSIEYWVMRSLWVTSIDDGRRYRLTQNMIPALNETSRLEINQRLLAGEVGLTRDGCLAEPVIVFDDEMKAHEHQVALSALNPSEEFRVVMSMDFPI